MWRTVEQLANGLGVRMIDITGLVEALDRH
jgi:hypothetical protein